MFFRLLGPLELIVDGRQVALPKPRSRAVLARLLLSANRLVTMESLVDALWAESPPATARSQIQMDISALRRTMRECGLNDPIKTSSAGYQMSLAPTECDLFVFERLTRCAHEQSETGDLETASASLRSALDLWRDPPLGDVESVFAADARVALTEQYLLAVEDWADLELRIGRPRRVMTELAPLAKQHPLREGLIHPMVMALHQAGRTPEALAALRALRTSLATELGLDLPPGLAELEVTILRGGPGVAAAPGSRARPDLGVAVTANALAPRQLPAVTRHFVGRTAEVEMLDLMAADSEIEGATVIAVIAGTAGVGKTALAVQWASRFRDRYPDGQLYVNLCGFDPSGASMQPADAIRRFLDALAVPPQQIPADPQAQADLYRSLLARRRMLLLLDNARDADQVRPLLPGAAGCFVLITSRSKLTGLVAAEGATPLPLNLLTDAEARELLLRRLGPTRVAAEPKAVADLIAGCARLPMALTIVAANAAVQPHFRLAVLAGQLNRSRDRLKSLSTGDTATTDLRAVFSWSYEALTTGGARMFRLLGLHSGSDISLAAAASLAAVPVDVAQPLLAELTTAHLVAEHVPERFAFHDLLRAYAAELARDCGPASESNAAIARLLSHYLHTAHSAALLLMPHRDPISLPSALSPPPHPVSLAGYEQAMAWFAAEHESVLAAQDLAERSNLDTYVWQLAWTLQTFLDRRGQWQRLLLAQRRAVMAAERLADPHALSRAHRQLGFACLRLDRYEDAHRAYATALRHAQLTGDRVSEARARLETAMVFEKSGGYAEAARHARLALTLYEGLQHQAGLARALNAVSWYSSLLGEHRQAITYGRQALTLFQSLANSSGEAETLHSIGHAHHHLGDYPAAIAHYRQSLEIKQALGHRLDAAQIMIDLGKALQRVANHADAHHTWHEALAMLDELDHPDAHRYRAKILEHVTERPELTVFE